MEEKQTSKGQVGEGRPDHEQGFNDNKIPPKAKVRAMWRHRGDKLMSWQDLIEANGTTKLLTRLIKCDVGKQIERQMEQQNDDVTMPHLRRQLGRQSLSTK